MKKPIAGWVISNTGSLLVWDMHNDESMLVGINDDTPEWCEIQHAIDGDEEVYSYIDFHGSEWRLDGCMRF
jgi:hypothetical protein